MTLARKLLLKHFAPFKSGQLILAVIGEVQLQDRCWLQSYRSRKSPQSWINKQTGICPGMHTLCFLRSVWLWLSLSMTHCHTATHFLTQKADVKPPSNDFALTHTNRETLCRHTDSLIQAMGTLVLKIYIKSGSIYKPFFLFIYVFTFFKQMLFWCTVKELTTITQIVIP